MEANIARNRRATDWQTDDDTFFDPELYRRRAVVEHANAWFDSVKTLLVRYETSAGNWLAFHWRSSSSCCGKLRLKYLSKQLHSV